MPCPGRSPLQRQPAVLRFWPDRRTRRRRRERDPQTTPRAADLGRPRTPGRAGAARNGWTLERRTRRQSQPRREVRCSHRIDLGIQPDATRQDRVGGNPHPLIVLRVGRLVARPAVARRVIGHQVFGHPSLRAQSSRQGAAEDARSCRLRVHGHETGRHPLEWEACMETTAYPDEFGVIRAAFSGKLDLAAVNTCELRLQCSPDRYHRIGDTNAQV
jgi:hypothetical protein